MAGKAARDSRRSEEPEVQPSLTRQAAGALLARLLHALDRLVLESVTGKKPAPAPRPHWEDVVDMNAAALPMKRNPSSWSHRITVAAIALVGAILAAYMSLYELHLIDSVWDPVFGRGTERMLTSEVAGVIALVFHVPDALLGTAAYATEIILALSGSSRRWQFRPWLVALFGLNVVGLACVSAALVCSQGLIVHSWCFLCLWTAAVSFTLFGLSIEEVHACLRYLWRVWKHSASPLTVLDTFLGRASRYAEEAALVGTRNGMV